ncbi:archaellum operon transcriptional activator EarA family protein [Methanocella sp. MCL-LM]|uniref:archaellum operon transcriptional activator EarA family protein n=1 Tax=Methanocella sp. MCL-LM TaxID=3412035 RepID=UPI003C7454DF
MVENCANQADIGLVYRSLKYSRARMDLYHRLCDVYPLEVSGKELARYGNLTLANAFGALVGNGDYQTEKSLVGLGLAVRIPAIVDGKTLDLFRATEYGLEIKYRMMDYRQRLGPTGAEARVGSSVKV